jgi:hypothetical protein
MAWLNGIVERVTNRGIIPCFGGFGQLGGLKRGIKRNYPVASGYRIARKTF